MILTYLTEDKLLANMVKIKEILSVPGLHLLGSWQSSRQLLSKQDLAQSVQTYRLYMKCEFAWSWAGVLVLLSGCAHQEQQEAFNDDGL